MLINSVSCLSKKRVNVIDWGIAAMMPPSPGQLDALGFAGAVAGVHDDMLVIAGGANFPDSMPWEGGKKKYYSDVFVYERRNGNISLHKKLFKLPSAIAYAASCSTPKGIVYAGGENENGFSDESWLMQWDAITHNIRLTKLPDLPIAISNASATANGNYVYVAGGETATTASDHFYSLDLNNIAAGWKQLPAIPKPISHSVLLVQSNGNQQCIYLIGGRAKKTNGVSEIYSSVYKFDLEKNHWVEKKSLPYQLCAGTGIAEGSESLLLFGGDKGETFHSVELLIAAINSEKTDSIKQKLVSRKNELQASHPGFSREILLYNTNTNEWTSIGDIPFTAPVTTTAVKWGENIVIPTGEIRAGVRTPQILIGNVNGEW